MSIAKKLIVLVVATVVVIVISLGIVGYLIISSSGDENALKALDITKKSMQAEVDAKLESYSILAQMLGHDGELSAAIAANRPEALKAVARRIINMPGVGQFTVCDMRGVVIVRGHSEKKGDTISMDRLMVAIPLKEGKHIVGLEPGELVRLSLGAGVPISHEGKQVGVAVIGANLASGEFVNAIKTKFGVECTIFHGDTRISTTVMRDGKPFIDTKLGNEAILAKVIRQGEVAVERNTISGQEFDTIYWPWKDFTGNNVGMFFVGVPRADIIASQNQIIMYFIGIGAVLGLILIGVGIISAKAISRPLQRATAYAEQVAAGDFGGELAVATKDEVGVLARALGVMVENLKAKIGEADERSHEASAQAEKAALAMADAERARQDAEKAKRDGMLAAAGQLEGMVHIISAASEELSAQIEQSERGSSEQAARVAETATAMEEMNNTVLEVARNASSAFEASAQTRSKAEEGARVVHSAVSGIQDVQTVSLSLKGDMTKLAEQAQSISAIMNVISDIADQTNLLALNAAIEAARAGEAGRGFAVVADEVRKLAEKTVTSTTDVGKAIQSIQQSVRQSISQVDKAVELIDIATKQSNSSGEALSEIVVMMDGTADQVSAIATASEQQSSTSEEINRSISHINEIAEQTAQAMREASRAVSDMASQAHDLSRVIEEMKRG
ncbi:MAG: methyl-accepting chemotaxis protein [Deltaproteobacteria bacterium]|jgi:methyl-accepting chemotaxis protein|nr:methyl-accepting chemotaxis protein [Deltaproteobacteria bacterium]